MGKAQVGGLRLVAAILRQARPMQVLLPPNARDLAQRHLVPRVQRVPLSAAAVATRCTCARRACWSLIPVQACACVARCMQHTPVTQHATRNTQRKGCAVHALPLAWPAAVGCTRVSAPLWRGGVGVRFGAAAATGGAAAAFGGGRCSRRHARSTAAVFSLKGKPSLKGLGFRLSVGRHARRSWSSRAAIRSMGDAS